MLQKYRDCCAHRSSGPAPNTPPHTRHQLQPKRTSRPRWAGQPRPIRVPARLLGANQPSCLLEAKPVRQRLEPRALSSLSAHALRQAPAPTVDIGRRTAYAQATQSRSISTRADPKVRSVNRLPHAELELRYTRLWPDGLSYKRTPRLDGFSGGRAPQLGYQSD